MAVAFAKFRRSEVEYVERIIRRAEKLLNRPLFDIRMDIAAVHAQHPLRLAELAKADDFQFAHDVCGIQEHLDRETGELRNCFVPRFSA